MRVPLFDGRREFEADRDDLMRAAEEVLASGEYILGERVRRFEDEVARYVGGGHAVGVASGTDALMLALKAAGVGPGDRVLTTPFSFFATAGAIVNAGAVPVFADIEPDTLNLDPAKAREVLEGGNIRAIVPVHLFGLPVDLDRFAELGRDFGVPVIQDAAQAFGSRYRGRAIGADPDLTTFSFFPTKNLGGFGDGGMIVTPSEEHAERVRLLRAHGATGKYLHDVVGTNSRLDALQAALLSVRLSRIDEALASRARIADAYDRGLSGVGRHLVARPSRVRRPDVPPVRDPRRRRAARPDPGRARGARRRHRRALPAAAAPAGRAVVPRLPRGRLPRGRGGVARGRLVADLPDDAG